MQFSVIRQTTPTPQPPPAVRLLLQGELDIAISQRLADAIAAEIVGGHRLVVDLSEVSFLDASCVGILLHGRDKASSRRLDYLVVGAQGVAQEVLRVCGALGKLT